MSKINELLSSIILYSVFSYLLSLPNLEYGLMFAILGSQINILFPRNYKHTLIFLIPFSLLVLISPEIFFPLMIGYISSIFISLLSKDGCKLLYPLKETTFTGPKNYLENNTKQDYATTMFLITLTTITLLLSFNGMQVIDDLSQNNNVESYFNNYETNRTSSPEVVEYININPAYCLNKNITTIKSENTTTTLITEYKTK